jgi:AraC-like DNA-binding protein
MWLDISKSYLFIIPVYGWLIYIIFKPHFLMFPVRSIRVWMDRWQLDQLSPKTKSIINRIEEADLHLKKELQISDIAMTLKISGSELNKLVREELAISVIQLINLLRIQEMKSRYLLPEYRNYTLLGLAQDVGFTSKSTFYRAFKDFTGYSPSEYFKLFELEMKENPETQVI